MNSRLVRVLLGAGMAALPAAASAQQGGPTVATVREVVRVVKKAQGGNPVLVNASLGTTLTTGDRLRTAGRSRAGLRFADQSIIRLGELTEVIITNPNRKGVQVTRGQVFADYKSPGTITGGYAVAAVRGTQVHYTVGADGKADVRCYEGRIYVSSADNPVSAGETANLTATTLQDDQLIGSDRDWTGAEIQFTEGPYAGQKRKVKSFDATTGTLTFEQALGDLAAVQAAPSGWLLVTNPNRPIVQLTKNTGTQINTPGGNPTPPQPVPSAPFANLQQNPITEGTTGEVSIFNGTADFQDFNQQVQGARNAVDNVVLPPVTPGGGGPGPTPPPDPDCIFPEMRGSRRLARGGRAQSYGIGRMLTVSAQGQNNVGVPTREEIVQPAMILAPWETNITSQVAWRFEPFAFTSNRSDSLGARTRIIGTQGSVYAELGYLYQLIDGQSRHDVSEGFIHVKGKHGNVIAGRQHLYLGPANNTMIGTLLGLQNSDAIMYEAPLKRGFYQSAGYIFDSRAMGRGGLAGAFFRGRAPVHRGYVGYSLLTATEGRSVGWSIDTTQSIIKNVLDIYAEGGFNVRDKSVTTVGFYVPALYQAAKLDLFLEYANREDRMERVSLRLRRQFLKNLLLLGFIDREPGDRVTLGGGILYSITFK